MDNENKIYIGKTAFSWLIREYNSNPKSNTWYLIAGIICLLLIGYAVITANFLFALIILLFIFIIVLRDFYTPQRFSFKITDLGVVVGDKFYPYKEISSFHVIYEPPQSKFLYFKLRYFSPLVSIWLDDQNPVKVREYLLQYLSEDLRKDDEDFSDSLNRLLKL